MDTPCKHRGLPTDKVWSCGSCKKRLHLFACRKRELCLPFTRWTRRRETLTRQDGVTLCDRCGDREE